MEKLIAEFAELYKATRIAKGIIDYNQEAAIAYAVADTLNFAKHSSNPIEYLKVEIEFQRECLEKLVA